MTAFSFSSSGLGPPVAASALAGAARHPGLALRAGWLRTMRVFLAQGGGMGFGTEGPQLSVSAPLAANSPPRHTHSLIPFKS